MARIWLAGLIGMMLASSVFFAQTPRILTLPDAKGTPPAQKPVEPAPLPVLEARPLAKIPDRPRLMTTAEHLRAELRSAPPAKAAPNLLPVQRQLPPIRTGANRFGH